MPDLPTCAAPECERPARNRMLCWAHYKRLRKYASFDLPTTKERIRSKVSINPESECWEWTGAVERNGYARMSVSNKVEVVHRIAYREWNGPIPDGLTIDHLCRNRRCCNPDHLEAVTIRDNIMRSPFTQASINAAKTHCYRGHELAGGNLHVNRQGQRSCRACVRIKTAAYRARKAA